MKVQQFHQWVFQLKYISLDYQVAKIGQKWWKSSKSFVKIVWRGCDSERECMKVSPLNFQPQVLTSRHQTCWYWPKNCQNRPVCEKCVSVLRSVLSVWKSHQWISQFKYKHLDTQIADICQIMVKIREYVWKVCEHSVKECVRKLVKVSQMNFQAQIHTLRHQTCWNWQKNGKNSPKVCEEYVKSVWECECVNVWKCSNVWPVNF